MAVFNLNEATKFSAKTSSWSYRNTQALVIFFWFPPIMNTKVVVNRIPPFILISCSRCDIVRLNYCLPTCITDAALLDNTPYYEEYQGKYGGDSKSQKSEHVIIIMQLHCELQV